DFTPRRDEDHLGVSAGGIREDVGAARDARGRRVFVAIERGESLPRERQDGRLMAELEDITVGLHDFVGIAWPQYDQARDGAQRYELLDGLMGGTVLSVSHGVVREHDESGQLHQGG